MQYVSLSPFCLNIIMDKSNTLGGHSLVQYMVTFVDHLASRMYIILGNLSAINMSSILIVCRFKFADMEVKPD